MLDFVQTTGGDGTYLCLCYFCRGRNKISANVTGYLNFVLKQGRSKECQGFSFSEKQETLVSLSLSPYDIIPYKGISLTPYTFPCSWADNYQSTANVINIAK